MASKLIFLSGAAGLDEAGRGPLAGPVAAAAVILPDGWMPAQLNDSKKLTPAVRDRLYDEIMDRCQVGLSLVEADEIDRLNILRASLTGMVRALSQISPRPAQILVDGNQPLPGIECETVVKGDSKYACIAAASIIAKVSRDRLMTSLAEEFPEYGFDRHFGYPTPDHLEALRRLGPCRIHRRSYGPVREALGSEPLQGVLL